MQCGTSGHYYFRKKKDGVVIQEYPVSDNLITDNGLQLMGTTYNYLSYCYVSESELDPATTDTALDGVTIYQASNTSVTDGSTLMDQAGDGDYRYMSASKVFQFDVAVAQWTVGQIGVGPDNTNSNLFSKARIVNLAETPTTITVEIGEQLEVVYELRFYVDTVTPVTSVFTIGADTYRCQCLPSKFGTDNQNEGWNFFTNNSMDFQNASSASNYDGYTGTIVDYNSLPSGDKDWTSSGSFAVTHGSITGTNPVIASLDLLVKNTAPTGTLRTIVLKQGPGLWQLQLDKKNSVDPDPVTYNGGGYVLTGLNHVTFTLEFSWGRYV